MPERKCEICGKVIRPLYVGEWKYKTKTHYHTYYYCSYSCFKQGETNNADRT